MPYLGEFTTVDMAAGDTVFGEHEGLVAQVPRLMSSTAEMMKRGELHPMILSARFHGFFEYLHPFRDGNGRTGRLLSNFILLRHDYPELIIQKEDRQEYIAALRTIRTEGTDEHLIAFFFKAATKQMENALAQKKQNSRTMFFFLVGLLSFILNVQSVLLFIYNIVLIIYKQLVYSSARKLVNYKKICFRKVQYNSYNVSVYCSKWSIMPRKKPLESRLRLLVCSGK